MLSHKMDLKRVNMFMRNYQRILLVCGIFNIIDCTFHLVISAEEVTAVLAETHTSVAKKEAKDFNSLTTASPPKIGGVETVVEIGVSQGSIDCFAKPYVRLQIYETSSPALVYVINPHMSRGATNTGYGYDSRVDGDLRTHVIFNKSTSEIEFTKTGAARETFYISVFCYVNPRTSGASETDHLETMNISVTFIGEHGELLTPIVEEPKTLVVNVTRLANERLLRLKPPDHLVSGWIKPRIRLTSDDDSSTYYAAHAQTRHSFASYNFPNIDYDKFVIKLHVDLNLRETLPFDMETTHNINITIWHPTNETNIKNSKNVPARTNITYPVEIRIVAMEFKFEQDSTSVTVLRNATYGNHVVVNRLPHYISAGMDIFYSLEPLDILRAGIKLDSKSGILYVDNVTALQTSPMNEFSFTMSAHDTTRPHSTLSSLSSVEITLLDTVKLNCVTAYCAQFDSETDCTSFCGNGSSNGWCKWRAETRMGMGGHYATCSPDFTTCPDGTCDEVEQKIPNICPQDCTDEKIVGMAPKPKSESVDRVGIQNGFGICKCEMMIDEVSSRCMCYNRQTASSRIITEYNATFFTPAPKHEYSTTVAANINTTYETEHIMVRTSDTGPCDFLCITVLSSVGIVFTALVIFGMFVIKRYPCSGRVAGTQYKPGLIGTPDGLLNTVPSEYVDDRFMLQRIKSEYDAKWEFPRTNLVLEEILGEGEFGRVMKAQALSIRGHTGYQTVAVKMLKNSATNAELQDLITELSLLKQVNHPNVIRLLGATTQKGPLFVIVEYCEYGCLKLFLRQNRKTAIPNSDYMGVEPEPRTMNIGTRELMSFAWQVCKGMHYLASMKLVHRDLAARNVLVAEGLIMKISDFGLTRDIYEGDTYMKKSKSRMPVKWMAIEALYDNIYTIKSDIWSFGILLWEIVTMGATPYPGLASERLYHILKNGYRMERPEGCSDELFRIMQRCWQLVPTSRPSFFDLVDIFEKMLEKDSEYLDLSAELPIDSDNEEEADPAEASVIFCPMQQPTEGGEEETSLKVLLSNASYSAMPGASKSSETSFSTPPPPARPPRTLQPQPECSDEVHQDDAQPEEDSY